MYIDVQGDTDCQTSIPAQNPPTPTRGTYSSKVQILFPTPQHKVQTFLPTFFLSKRG